MDSTDDKRPQGQQQFINLTNKPVSNMRVEINDVLKNCSSVIVIVV